MLKWSCSRTDAETLDRRIKWALLVVSLATLALLVVSALRENVFAPWRMARGQYATILKQKATDERGRALADQFKMEIVQNVLPDLHAVDRCITCHPGIDDPRMADQKNPYKTHPGDFLLEHPPEKFGCTICHRGQGRALVFAEAKAEEYHWDFPMLPPTLTQSSCGLCHTADEVEHAGGEKYALGKQLFEARGCIGCHRLQGRGGNAGPALDAEGRKVRGLLPMAHVRGPHTLAQWLKEHFEDPQKVVAESQMPPPQLLPEENEALTIYMLSLQSRDLPESYISPQKHLDAYQSAYPAEKTGEQLFTQYCGVCHDTGAFGRYDGFYKKFFPAVRGPSLIQVASSEYLDQNIRLGRPGTLMPGWARDAGGLSDAEIRKTLEYLQSGATGASPEGIPEAAVAAARDPNLKVSGDAGRGAVIFAKYCSACHGPAGEGKLGPALQNATFQKTATDGFLHATIAYGRRNTAMPAFLGPEAGGFAESDIADLVAHVRTLVPAKTGQTAALASAGQHAPDHVAKEVSR